MHYKEIKECLACGGKHLRLSFSMGFQPLVNNLKSDQFEEDVRYPLEINKCRDCTHEQLTIAVDPKILFENYLYQTGTSDSHKVFLEDFVSSLTVGYIQLNNVLDIGCNDGTLLSIFKHKGWVVRGIDPSNNFQRTFTEKKIPLIQDFFPSKELEGKHYDIITAFNVFAHNDNPFKFLIEAKKLLKENGRIFLLTTPSRLDNFYHEHISYFNLKSMTVLAERCGLEIKSFKTTAMHGESHLFELCAKKQESYPIKDQWKNLVAYGAAASGIVILNYMNIIPEYVIDDNALKQGKYISGNIPIFPNEHLKMDKRSLTILILAHHLSDEIVAKIKKLRPNKKDVFVHPYKGIL